MSDLLDLAKHLHRKKDSGVSFVQLVDGFMHRESVDVYTGKRDSLDIEREEAGILLQLAKRQHKSASAKQKNYRDVFLHPSSIGRCARETFFRRFKAPKNMRLRGSVLDVATQIRRFDNGKYFHLRMQVLFVRMGLCGIEDIEVPFTHGDLQGTCDAIATVKGRRFIVDFKSSNSYIFRTLGGTKSKFLEGYNNQMWMYMRELGIPNGVFLYENKDNHALAEVFIKMDAKFRKENEGRLAYLRKCVKNRALPAGEGKGLTEYPCKTCNYTGVCYDEEDQRKWLRSLGKSRKRRLLPKK